MQIGQTVKYTNPQEGESELRFELIGVNENTQCAHIRLIDSMFPIAPIESVAISDVTQA